MDKLIAQFPKQISDAIEIALDSHLSFYKGKTFSNVIACGMGGSGIGGKMISTIFADQLRCPIVPISDYDLPNFVDKNTLVIASSYSGNTEETINAIHQAEKKGATVIGVSSGGELIRHCKKANHDFIKIPGGNPPRAMLAFSLVQLIYILTVAEVIPKEAFSSLNNCRNLLNKELISIKKEAKIIAELINGKHCVFYADTRLEPVTIRARQQINENSKQLCWNHVIPEMNHNELVGWTGGTEHHAALFFTSQFLSEKNKLRFAFCENAINDKTKSWKVVNGKGKSIIEEVFYFIHIIDWASFYLSQLNHNDPVEVRIIEKLKKALSND